LVDDSFTALECLPHGDVTHCMTCDHKVIYFAHAVNRVILVYVRHVRVVQSILNITQKVIGMSSWRNIISASLLINHWGVTVLFAPLVHYPVRAHDNIFILVHKLFRTIQFLTEKFVLRFSVFVDVADLGV
jgi:hypothetical protein